MPRRRACGRSRPAEAGSAGGSSDFGGGRSGVRPRAACGPWRGGGPERAGHPVSACACENRGGVCARGGLADRYASWSSPCGRRRAVGFGRLSVAGSTRSKASRQVALYRTSPRIPAECPSLNQSERERGPYMGNVRESQFTRRLEAARRYRPLIILGSGSPGVTQMSESEW